MDSNQYSLNSNEVSVFYTVACGVPGRTRTYNCLAASAFEAAPSTDCGHRYILRMAAKFERDSSVSMKITIRLYYFRLFAWFVAPCAVRSRTIELADSNHASPSSDNRYRFCAMRIWCTILDLNQGPPPYQDDALPTELMVHVAEKNYFGIFLYPTELHRIRGGWTRTSDLLITNQSK